MNILKHFPSELKEPRSQQTEALKFFESAFQRSNIVVAELPTGSGKSGVAMALSRAYGGGIIVTPRLALQKQYCDEFDRSSPLMGRGNFYCLELSDSARNTIPIILRGEHPPKPHLDHSCASAPCLNRPQAKQQRIKEGCKANGGCPHEHSIIKAQESETIVSNFHSLMYCVSLNERVAPRKILIFDECHGLANQLRDFLKVKFKVKRKVLDVEISHLKTTLQWCQWLMLPEQAAQLHDQDQRDSWKARLEKLSKVGNTVQNCWRDPQTDHLFVEFTPTSVASAAQSMLFGLAEKIVFLSGTIFSKDDFLKPLGFEPGEIPYLRVASDFPKENRPVYLPKEDARDLSFKGWKQNFPWMIGQIKAILEKRSDVKGIIHVNSYKAANEIVEALKSDRIISHDSENFAKQLQGFYNTDEPKVFISPNVGEGYSFDDDLARFQIIVTPKYDPASDAYVKYLLDNGRWDVYNAEALKVFGQQLGRVVRSKTDKGETYLIGSGFNNLIKKSWKRMPDWLKISFKRS